MLMVKNLPASVGDTEMRAPFLGWEGPLDEETATHSSILAWESPWTEDLMGYHPWGCRESDVAEVA